MALGAKRLGYVGETTRVENRCETTRGKRPGEHLGGETSCYRKNARNLYHKTRRLYNKHKTEHYKTLLKNVSKHYKNTVSKNIKKHRDEKIDKLHKLKTSNSKDFWRIINDDKCKPNKSALVRTRPV